MDFTREPIVETVITPREGCKIVVRSSKASGQEEFFVDALEVVSFGHSQFFRSLEKPKPFLVPTSDYEVLEVREARMVLKSVGIDRSIKIGGGKEAPTRVSKERDKEKDRERDRERAPPQVVEEPAHSVEPAKAASEDQNSGTTDDPRFERRRDRRRHYRRRRGREEGELRDEEEGVAQASESDKNAIPFAFSDGEGEQGSIALEPPRGYGSESQQPTSAEAQQMSHTVFSSLLSPPPNLISETIARYRENEKFKGAFYPKEQRNDRRRDEQKFSEEEAPSFIPEDLDLPPVSDELVTFHLGQTEQVSSVEETLYIPTEAHFLTPNLFVEESASMDAASESQQQAPDNNQVSEEFEQEKNKIQEP